MAFPHIMKLNLSRLNVVYSQRELEQLRDMSWAVAVRIPAETRYFFLLHNA
jgi:hypothetical protein